MTGKLEFDLTTEAYEHEVATRAMDILIVLDAIDSELRSALKYETGAFGKCDLDTIEKIRSWIWDKRSQERIPELR
jgi:hypothetical protein